MADYFVLCLLGHLTGDYLFQTKDMALNKSNPGHNGFIKCTLHVAIYTLAICLFWQTANVIIATLVFIPHWIIDRWSLGSKWLKFIGGRTLEAAAMSKDQFREFDVASSSVVYTVVDNSMHLLCLWLVIEIFLI